MTPRTTLLLPVALLAVACAAPGVDIAPEPTDFAVVEVTLLG
jgi:hypothetical protein